MRKPPLLWDTGGQDAVFLFEPRFVVGRDCLITVTNVPTNTLHIKDIHHRKHRCSNPHSPSSPSIPLYSYMSNQNIAVIPDGFFDGLVNLQYL